MDSFALAVIKRIEQFKVRLWRNSNTAKQSESFDCEVTFPSFNSFSKWRCNKWKLFRSPERYAPIECIPVSNNWQSWNLSVLRYSSSIPSDSLILEYFKNNLMYASDCFSVIWTFSLVGFSPGFNFTLKLQGLLLFIQLEHGDLLSHLTFLLRQRWHEIIELNWHLRRPIRISELFRIRFIWVRKNTAVLGSWLLVAVTKQVHIPHPTSLLFSTSLYLHCSFKVTTQ